MLILRKISAAAGDTWKQAKEKAGNARAQTEIFVRENPVPIIVSALALGIIAGWALRHATMRDECLSGVQHDVVGATVDGQPEGAGHAANGAVAPLVHDLVSATGYQLARLPTSLPTAPPAPTGGQASSLAAHISGASWGSGATALCLAWRRARPGDTFKL